MARRQKQRSKVFVVSVAAHVAVAAVLALIPQQKLREVVAIAMSEADPKKDEKKPEPPKPPERPAERPQRSAARNARPAPVAAEAPPQAADPSAFADIGLALDASAADGIAVAIARPAPVAAPVAAPPPPKPKVLVAKPTEVQCTEPIVKARVLQRNPPTYTEQAHQNHVAGAIRLALDIDERGEVAGARVLQGLGFGLDEAALEAARRWRFAPATQCNKPVASTFTIRMRFGSAS